MSWVRLDDKFPSHPKVAQLTDREFRVHIRVLCYCGEYATNGQLGAGIWNEIPGLTKAMGKRFVKLGLWDETGSQGGTGGTTYSVHDFEQYNAATLEERVRAILLENPEASGNQVHKLLGGRREAVLNAVAKLKAQFPGGTTPGSQPGTTVPPQVVPEVVLTPAPTPAPNGSSTVTAYPTHPVVPEEGGWEIEQEDQGREVPMPELKEIPW